MELFMFTKKRLIHFLVLILALMSIFRLLRISTITGTFSFTQTTLKPLLPSVLNKYSSYELRNSSSQTTATIPKLTMKEYKFLANLIRKRSPCNLLIFGLGPQYLHLSQTLNSASGGTTVILEDNPENLRLFNPPSSNHTANTTTFVFRVSYELQAKDAFDTLQHARNTPSCSLHESESPSSTSSCRLAIKTGFPSEVYRTRWDVIVVDGPSSDGLYAPGRMSSIYTAAVLAKRSGSLTNVVVHDVDRTIEKWFAWEFLSDENLVSSKGKFWNFEIPDGGGGDHQVQVFNSNTTIGNVSIRS